MKNIFLFIAFLFSWNNNIIAQEEANYNETKVPAFTLPDPLSLQDGRIVASVEDWEKWGRPETLHIFEEQVYGKIPYDLKITSFSIVEEGENSPYENAIRKQVEMLLDSNGRQLRIGMLIYLPKKEYPVPLFIGYNFDGNHLVTSDSSVLISDVWARYNTSPAKTSGEQIEVLRGTNIAEWPIGEILKSGYGVATIYYEDVDADRDDFTDGVHPYFYHEGQTHPGTNEWGAISAWAWGLSRAMDYFETDTGIDASKIAVIGHSRLGKAALWAGATDRRFAIVVSNNSGCGGAALSRRRFGETVSIINKSFPYWFCDNFKAYNDNENNLPIDQHQLVALIAPRPVYIASAAEDLWADPKGEYLAGYYASPVYRLYGKKGFESPKMPGVGKPVMNDIGYHIREGKHDVTLYDWKQFIRFANMHFYGK